MRWHKRGLIYAPSGELAWARSNASFPTAEIHETGVVRVYFTALDDNDFGRGGYVDLDPDDPRRIISVTESPILDLGPIGDFDDAGANPFAVISFRGKRLMYYQGWQRTLRAPYMILTGLAIQDGNGPFVKPHRIPVLERTDEDTHIRGAPFIIEQNGELTMWYVASGEWSHTAHGLRYRVRIRHARSADGVNWVVTPGSCIEPGPDEFGVGRPVVFYDGSAYHMWYSIRSFTRPYRMGYAISQDGLIWTRMDSKAGITASETGWDSEMLCYGYVLLVGQRLFMFYNGNKHGATGFGLAELDGALI